MNTTPQSSQQPESVIVFAGAEQTGTPVESQPSQEAATEPIDLDPSPTEVDASPDSVVPSL